MSYPFYSPYSFSGNRVIASIELEGLEPVDLNSGARIDFGTQTELQVLNSSDYSMWQDMLQWEKSREYGEAMSRTRGGNSKSVHRSRQVYGQTMGMAAGDQLNTDYYAVNISKLPNGMSQAELYDHLRKNIGGFMNPDIAELEPYIDNVSGSIWNSSNPTGSIMTFHNIMDDATVVTTKSSENYWVFTPVFAPLDLSHPLAGHRQFGLSGNKDGSYTFYTRGVDMMSGVADALYNELNFNSSMFFGEADELWNGVMNGIMNYINENGGEATMTHSFNRRISWGNDVKDEDK